MNHFGKREKERKNNSPCKGKQNRTRTSNNDRKMEKRNDDKQNKHI